MHISFSDGFPTYHLANVVDDHHMQISHVLRGYEWQVSTSKHWLLYQAFGWTPPIFGHLPLIINPDGSKLSKRQGHIHVEHYRDQGYYPETILNFAITAGGGFHLSNENELNDMSDLVQAFDITELKTSFSQLNFVKLDALNKLALQSRLKIQPQLMIKDAKDHLVKTLGQVPLTDEMLLFVLNLDRINRITDLTINPDVQFIWHSPKPSTCLGQDILGEIMEIINSNNEFRESNSLIRKMTKRRKTSYPETMQKLRQVLTGLPDGLPIKDIYFILGKEQCLERVNNSLIGAKIKSPTS